MKNVKKVLIMIIILEILVLIVGAVYMNTMPEKESWHTISVRSGFNSKFEKFEGVIRGSEVNAMLKTVITSNNEAYYNGDYDELVEVKGAVNLSSNARTLDDKADTSKLYNISIEYDEETGYVSKILVDEQEIDEN